jgi:mRNA interferase YafQ
MNKYELVITNSFKRDFKKIKKRGYKINELKQVVDILLSGAELPEYNKDHNLTGKWRGYRECHIQPDWLLVYRIYDDKLILSLVRTGTHSDLNF